MIIDIIFAILVIWAIVKGYQRGLILGLFSLIGVVVGLAAAMKLSTVVAGWLGSAIRISEKWLPVISFIATFLLVLLLIRLGARALEKTAELVTLGWLNKLGGILFYGIIYILVFSVVLFYAEQISILRTETIADSSTYAFVSPWAPRVIDSIGRVIPLFRDMFGELEEFFGGLAQEA